MCTPLFLFVIDTDLLVLCLITISVISWAGFFCLQSWVRDEYVRIESSDMVKSMEAALRLQRLINTRSVLLWLANSLEAAKKELAKVLGTLIPSYIDKRLVTAGNFDIQPLVYTLEWFWFQFWNKQTYTDSFALFRNGLLVVFVSLENSDYYSQAVSEIEQGYPTSANAQDSLNRAHQMLDLFISLFGNYSPKWIVLLRDRAQTQHDMLVIKKAENEWQAHPEKRTLVGLKALRKVLIGGPFAEQVDADITALSNAPLESSQIHFLQPLFTASEQKENVA